MFRSVDEPDLTLDESEKEGTTMLTLTLCLAAALAAPGESTWEGYLFRDEAARVRIGWPVVAMGVMAQAPHVLGGDLAKRLDPLVAPAKDDFVFWNYELETAGDATALALPTALVRLRGRVEGDTGSGSRLDRPRGDLTMADGRLVEVEFVDPEWLRYWSLFFRDPASPFRIAKETDSREESRARFAREALAALLAMRAVPPASEALLAKARAIDPSVRVMTRFRSRTEHSIQRWLVDLAAKKTVSLEGLDSLPPLPPTSVEVQRLFLEAKDRAAFLAAARAAYAGDLALVDLVHYVSNERSTWYAATPLDVVRDEWDEATFEKNRAATRATLGSSR